MAKLVICPICGKEFVTNKPNKKFCSFSCKEAGQTLRRLKWNDSNPKYMTEYMRKYRAERKDK